jgi:membrane protein
MATVTDKASETKRAGGPDEPTDVPRGGWWAVLKRTVKEFREDNLTDWAAALTYYGVLALFPALLALVSIVGLAGKDATNGLVDNVGAITSGPAKDVITGAITNLSKSGGTAGLTFVIGLALALWSASGYVGAFMRASNAIYEVEEGRPFWKLRPVQMGITLAMLLLVALAVIGIVVTGPLAKGVGDTIGVGDTAVTVWSYAKWPVILLVIMTCFAILYHLAPNVKQPGFKWITPGAVLGVVVWIVASVAFAFYVANFASYNKTYGTLGGVIAFLVWLWISNVAVLLGAELNAELEREREIEAGVPGAERELRLEPRDPPKDDD